MKRTKRTYILTVLGISLLATGCNMGATGIEDSTPAPYHNQENHQRFKPNQMSTKNNGQDQIIDFNGRTDLNEPKTNTDNDYGVVRVSRDDLKRLSQNPKKLDRNQLANMIAQAISSTPGLSDATIMVTDDHIFIGYNQLPNSSQKTGRNTMNEQLKIAAQSVVPRYFNVFVTDDKNVTNQILALTNGNTNNLDLEIDRILESDVKRLGPSNRLIHPGETNR